MREVRHGRGLRCAFTHGAWTPRRQRGPRAAATDDLRKSLNLLRIGAGRTMSRTRARDDEDHRAQIGTGNEAVERYEQRVRERGQGARSDSARLDWRVGADRPPRCHRDSHEEQADQRAAGAGAGPFRLKIGRAFGFPEAAAASGLWRFTVYGPGRERRPLRGWRADGPAGDARPSRISVLSSVGATG
jgi:hypothetical protein